MDAASTCTTAWLGVGALVCGPLFTRYGMLCWRTFTRTEIHTHKFVRTNANGYWTFDFSLLWDGPSQMWSSSSSKMCLKYVYENVPCVIQDLKFQVEFERKRAYSFPHVLPNSLIIAQVCLRCVGDAICYIIACVDPLSMVFVGIVFLCTCMFISFFLSKIHAWTYLLTPLITSRMSNHRVSGQTI